LDHYKQLIKPLNAKSVSFDMFAFSLTQYGQAEMKDLIQRTNGIVVNDEEFSNDFFIPNLERYFGLNFGPESVFGADLTILNS
jgi:hypothetical protein